MSRERKENRALCFLPFQMSFFLFFSLLTSIFSSHPAAGIQEVYCRNSWEEEEEEVMQVVVVGGGRRARRSSLYIFS